MNLDLGCGDRKREGCIGLDQRRTKSVDVVCDLARLSVKSDAIDEIYAISVLEHFENPYVVIDEIHRSLKKRGKATIHVPNIGTYDAHLSAQMKEGHRFLADWSLWNLMLKGYFNKVRTKPWHVKYRSSPRFLTQRILYAAQRLLIFCGFYDFARGFYFICTEKKEAPQKKYTVYCWYSHDTGGDQHVSTLPQVENTELLHA